ncbi:MAG TPA: biotin--[acetyl-CoA-carboxylase] ligase [Vicinamibacterales bacterium]|nr:biotin--[acetyl-CoA-carboxylase] ligase [Vicinamibacterales bacterium]
MSNVLPADIADALADVRGRLGRLASTVTYFPTIGSTNDVAATMAEGAIVIAGAQTEGRGRRGRSWFSPLNSGLYVSIVLAPSRSADPRRAVSLTTIAAGVALAEGTETATGLRVRLKWPNDLYVGRRKLAGILAEAAAAGDRIDAVVLGYGINVAEAAYPAELRDRVTSLESELGAVPPRARVLVETLAAMAARYEDLLAGRFDAILNGWRSRADANGARVEWTSHEGSRSGLVVDIDEDGALLVKTDVGIERIVRGEIVWL